MPLLDRVTRRLRILFRNQDVESELAEEVRLHLEMEADDLVQQGWNRAEAQREARLRMGGVEQTKEWVREARPLHWVGDLCQDLRSGGRLLIRNRAYAVLAILTLAIGIGSNTAVFTIVNHVLLKPLPYTDPERLVVVWERNSQTGKDRDPVAPRNLQDWVAGADRFENLAAYRTEGFALTGVGEAEQLTTLTSTANLFRVLGAEPLFGRTFTRQELDRNEPVVVLGHRFWRRRFQSDLAVVGSTIELDNRASTVVGVMPPGFDFPSTVANVDTYSPLTLAPQELTSRLSHTLLVIGKLRPDVSVEEAAEQLGVIASRIAEEEPTSNPEVAVLPAHEQMIENVRLSLVALAGAVGFVLLITCANVANLVMVRSSARSREIAIRSALGSSRMRIVRQLLTENLVLAALGGACGVLLAWVLIEIAVRLGPQSIPRLETVQLDSPMLAFALLPGSTRCCGGSRGDRRSGTEDGG